MPCMDVMAATSLAGVFCRALSQDRGTHRSAASAGNHTSGLFLVASSSPGSIPKPLPGPHRPRRVPEDKQGPTRGVNFLRQEENAKLLDDVNLQRPRGAISFADDSDSAPSTSQSSDDSDGCGERGRRKWTGLERRRGVEVAYKTLRPVRPKQLDVSSILLERTRAENLKRRDRGKGGDVLRGDLDLGSDAEAELLGFRKPFASEKVPSPRAPTAMTSSVSSPSSAPSMVTSDADHGGSRTRSREWEQLHLPKKMKERRRHGSEERMGSIRARHVMQLMKTKGLGRRGAVTEVMDAHGRDLLKGEVEEVMDVLRRKRNWRSTLELFQWTKKQPWFKPNAKFYSGLISFVAREGEAEAAINLFQEMLLERQTPNNYTYTALINAYVKAQKFTEALEVFEYMKSTDDADARPNTVTCNVLLGGLCKGGLYEAAVDIFWDMWEQRNGLDERCRPNIITYNMLIESLCREGHIDAALRGIRDLAVGRFDPTVEPNVVSYNTMIAACGKAGRAEAAEEVVEMMRANGVRQDVITYTALIDSYAKTGAWEKAEETFREMRMEGIEVDVFSCTALISAYSRAGVVERIDALIDEMNACGVRPNEVTFLAIVDAYGKAGNFSKAESAMQEMVSAGFRPNVYSWSSLIDAYGKSGLYKRAADAFEEMQGKGCVPNLVTYAAILSACARCSRWEDALTLLYALQRSGREYELAMCRLVLAPPHEPKLWENGRRMFEGFQSESRSMRRSFFNALINTLWSFGLRGRAAQVVEVGRSSGLYNKESFSYAPEEWSLDLHEKSVGSGAALLYSWLKELCKAWQWEENVPDVVAVITGWGKHSKRNVGESPLKLAIECELANLGSPFLESPSNPGRLVAPGCEVRKWLLSREVQRMLRLADIEQPRPAGEQPYVPL